MSLSLKLNRLVEFDDDEIKLIQNSRYTLNFVIFISEEAAIRYYRNFLKNFSKYDLIVICSSSLFSRAKIDFPGAKKIYTLVGSETNSGDIDLNDSETFSVDIEQVKSKAAKYFWPDLSFSIESALKLKSDVEENLPIIPLAQFNPDGCDKTNFSAFGRLLFSKTEKSTPELSIVIPHYENLMNLKNCLRSLNEELQKLNLEVEVIVVDDGSPNFDQFKLPEIGLFKNAKLVRLNRKAPRVMGDSAYRAGIARNTGVEFANAENILFLDCDILIGKDSLSAVIDSGNNADLIMLQRYQLKKNIQRSFSCLDLNADVDWSASPYWSDFYASGILWNELPNKWKYVSTFALSIKKDLFCELGQFNQAFVSYGCEDVDLGYKAHKKNRKFLLLPNKVFHLQPPENRSEFFFDKRKRGELQLKAFFYLVSLNWSREIYWELLDGEIYNFKNSKKQIECQYE
jgi:glycosyltransferase involved in cell wall biosynthesis